ncbi:MerR family transcriptional regulator [Geomonas sp. RF6]|uniref:MerR family transcriptional regulator n=1 Tax=Geomonas sp. RF6 TaxID=2897342 RepID=UPI001E5D6F96|nr:MerR family transcriptional regulator [Geomonas sp. RF6]UFS71892.1 MerR family transcriptional regulator [Geomonas sp. RF6]
MYFITDFAQQFGLSRSTLLYYDRIGLLSPTARSKAGYRLYSAADRERLESICSCRQTGLSIEEIKSIMAATSNEVTVLQQRLKAVGKEILALQAQQRLLAGMLRLHGAGEAPAAVDKEMFVDLLKAAGMDEAAMCQLHAEFEQRAPEAHQAFLLSLGISEREALLIRKRAADA